MDRLRTLPAAASVVLATTLLAPPSRAAQHDWTAQIEAFKPSVVNVETSSEVVFATESKGTGFATGFVVDAERGIIATNQHVTGSGPSNVKINFFNGTFTDAKELYYDPTHDFGFYRLDPGSLDFKLQAVTLGSGRDLELGQELLLIGNNDKEEYSIKFGRVANLNVNKGDRHSSYLHTTFDRTGGSSGSPVWNTAGEVVAIHARGTDTSSFELPIEYLRDALAKLRSGEPIARGEIGADLELISIGEAVRHFGLPEACRVEIGPSASGPPKVMQVESVVPRSTSDGVLRASDIVYRLDGVLLRDDLYTFDKMLDARVGGSVRLDVYRNGESLSIEFPVLDLENGKVRRFARFGGAVFHDLTPQLRWMLYYPGDGVFMSYAEAGSSFSRIGSLGQRGNAKIVIHEVNGVPVRSLDGFVAAVSAVRDGEHGYVVLQDFNLFDSSPTPRSLTFNLKFGGLEVFGWNPRELDWERLGLDR